MTTLIAVVGLALAALLETMAIVGAGGARVATAIALYGDSAMGLLAALVIAYAVWELEPGLSRSTWILIGAGVSVGAIADGLWAYGQATMGLPNLAFNLSDPFYFASYVLFGFAVARWIIAHRDRLDIAWIATESAVASAVLGAITWVGLIAPTLRLHAAVAPSTLDDVLWVIMDFPLIVAPTMALTIALVRLRDERAASQWVGYCAGVALIVLADIGWFWERGHGVWAPGSLVDFAFMASSVLLAISALTAVDIQAERTAEQALPGRLPA